MAERPCFSGVLDGSAHDGLWQWAQRQYGLKGSWQTLWLNGLPLGRLNPQWGAQLKKDWPGAVGEDSDGLHLVGESWAALGLSLQSTACGWREAGVLRGWRGEYFDVCDEAGRPLFALERAAFRPFGLLSRAIHLNGLTCRGGWRFWIGRRSADKAVDPNKLDNIVGGGVASGETALEAALRESEEEAGLGAVLPDRMRRQSGLHSLRPVSRGLHNEILHIFDVVLPPDFTPKNQDGEVAGFVLMDIPELVEAMLAGEMMDDAQLVTLDAFRRYGLLKPQHPLSQWLESLRRHPQEAV